MRFHHALAGALLTLGLGPLGLGPLALAQVGEPFPDIGLDDFAQTEAESFDDFAGRLILVEGFAYW